MPIWTVVIQAAIAALAFEAAALADDCSAVKTAILNSGHTPHTVTVTTTNGQGKKTLTKQIQTVDNKYVQVADGKWYAMDIGIKDLDDNTSGVLTCKRTGSDTVAGESTIVYAVHANLEGEVQDQKIWVSSNNRVLKSEGLMHGSAYFTEYDFSHVTPPAGAISMGGK